MPYQHDSHATSQTAIYANITQTGRIRVYCSWFWVVLVGFVGFGWFRVLVTACHVHVKMKSIKLSSQMFKND